MLVQGNMSGERERGREGEREEDRESGGRERRKRGREKDIVPCAPIPPALASTPWQLCKGSSP